MSVIYTPFISNGPLLKKLVHTSLTRIIPQSQSKSIIQTVQQITIFKASKTAKWACKNAYFKLGNCERNWYSHASRQKQTNLIYPKMRWLLNKVFNDDVEKKKCINKIARKVTTRLLARYLRLDLQKGWRT
jgi:hypothetical protein